MAGYEETVVVGELKKDPEIKYAASGTPVCRLSLVVDVKVGQEYKPKWWNATVFGKQAELTAEMCHKGTIVRVGGTTEVNQQTMTPDIYMKDDGPHTSNKLVVNRIDFISNFGKKKEEAASAATQDEIPF